MLSIPTQHSTIRRESTPLKKELFNLFKYTATSSLALSVLGLLYYYEVCDLNQGLSHSCGSFLVSLKINMGLPLIALEGAIKAQQVISKLLSR
jgi:hypothetical protein